MRSHLPSLASMLLIIAAPLAAAGAASAGPNAVLSVASDAPPPAHPTSRTPHAPIVIASDLDFTAGNGVSNPGAAGTAADPFIIEDWEIEVTSSHGLSVTGTEAHFIARNLTVFNLTSTTFRGVFFNGVMNGTVSDSLILGVYDGLVDANAVFPSGNRFIRNEVLDCDNLGISTIDSLGITVADNLVNNNTGGGLYDQFSTGSNYTNNTLWNNGADGLHFRGSTYNNISDNIVWNHTSSGIFMDTGANFDLVSGNHVFGSPGVGLYGIRLSAVSDTLVDGNIVHDHGIRGINVAGGGARNRVENNTIYNHTQFGMLASSIPDMVIANNSISNSSSGGFYLLSLLRARVLDNRAFDNGAAGIVASGTSTDSLYARNEAMGNADNGLWVSGSIAGVAITGNLLHENGINGLAVESGSVTTGARVTGNEAYLNVASGIYVYDTDGLNVSRNLAHNNSASGMQLITSADSNELWMNEFADNADHGVNVSNSGSNRIHHNNFLRNNLAGPSQAFDDGAGNLWNDSYPSGGNHWSDWVAPDAMCGPLQDVACAGDAIVDSPYAIAGGSASDFYPLTDPTPGAPEVGSPAALLILAIILIIGTLAGRRAVRRPMRP